MRRAPLTPVSGTFDDLGQAEGAVRALHAAGYAPESVRLVPEEGTVLPTSAPAPPSRSGPYALGTALLCGVIVAVLAALFAPETIQVSGFGWHVSSVLLLSLTAGAIGWMMGGILGFGLSGPDTAPPSQLPGAAPATVVLVATDAPERGAELSAHRGSARGPRRGAGSCTIGRRAAGRAALARTTAGSSRSGPPVPPSAST